MKEKDTEIRTSEYSVGLLRLTESVVVRNTAEVAAALQLLQRKLAMQPEVFDTVRRAELKCRETIGRVNALIELYGGKESQLPVRLASYDVRAFFEAVTAQINRALGDKKYGEVSFSMEDTEINAVFDARRVCMILYHLVSNALEHGKGENKQVVLASRLQNRILGISVRDYGGGIAEQRMKNLFVAFLDEVSIQAIAKGGSVTRLCGIGLPLCRKLANDMAGELSVKNYKNGAKFILRLPQTNNRIRETSVWEPDDILLQNCMAGYLDSVLKDNHKEEDLC